MLLATIMIGQEPAVFINRSLDLPQQNDSDYSLAVADLNGDYRDDIIRQTSEAWQFLLQDQDGRFLDAAVNIPKPFIALTTNITDIDGDYIPEILMSGNKTGISIVKFDPQGLNFRLDDHIESNHYAQGSCVGDMNGDGLLDYYAANDNGPNKSFINDGQELQEIVFPELNTLSGGDSEGNYNVLLFDPDEDGDIDVYVTKCHISANSFDDLRRINQFFENIDGDYVEASEPWGLDHGDQSWCSAAADLDNDGDQDLVLVNHGTPIMLLENEGEQFSTITEFSNSGEIIGDEQQVILEDFNNDGFVDIFIFGFNDQLLLNNKNLSFTAYNNPIGGSNAYSGACGDLNDDGWLDILAVYGTAGSGIDDKLWINFGGNRHFIKFSLNGKQSNSLGVSARLRVFANSDTQSRWINSGSSYGITNSLTAHFGLGNNTAVDSVKLLWPSGLEESFYDLDVDKHYIITEGECIEERAKMIPSSAQLDCLHDPVELNSSVQGNFNWINEAGITVSDAETIDYYYGIKNDVCRNATGIVLIDSLRELSKPKLLNPGYARLCEGTEYPIYIRGGLEYEWLDGNMDNSNIVNKSGVYFAIDAHQCDTLRSDTLIYEEISFIQNADQMLETSERTNLILDPGLGPLIWIDEENKVLAEANEFIIDSLFMDTVLYFMQFEESQVPSFSIGPIPVSGSLMLDSNDMSIDMQFNLNSYLEISSFEVFAEMPGLRRFIIVDESGLEVFTEDQVLSEGINRIDIKLSLLPGQYRVFTDTTVNMESLGQTGPGLYSMDQIPDSEYENLFIDFGQANNDSSNFCFNWHVKFEHDRCIDRPYAFEVKLDTSTSVKHIVPFEVKLYPNPGTDLFKLDTEGEIDQIVLFDSMGQKVWEKNKIVDAQIDLASDEIIPGTYFLVVVKEGERITIPLVKLP